MKNKVLISLVITLIVCIFVSCNVYADTNVKGTMSAEKDNNTITIIMSVPALEKGYAGFQGNIEYDSSKLEYDEENNEMTKGSAGWAEPTYVDNNGRGTFTILIKSNVIKDANDVIKLTLKVKDGAKGDTTIKITNIKGADGSDELITMEDLSKTVKLSSSSSSGGSENSGGETSGGNETQETPPAGNNTTNTNTENTNNTTVNNTVITPSKPANEITPGKTNTNKQVMLPQTGENTIWYTVLTCVTLYTIISLIAYLRNRK